MNKRFFWMVKSMKEWMRMFEMKYYIGAESGTTSTKEGIV